MNLRKALLAATIGLLLASAIPGCSDDDKNNAGEKFIADYCTLMATCCETWGGTNDNGAQCKTSFQYFALMVDPTYSDACVAQMRKDQAAGTLCESKPASSVSKDDPCQKVFGENQQQQQNGTNPAGTACEMSSECAAPAGGVAMCDSLAVDGGFVHYCQAVTAGKEGDGPCTANLYSNGSTVSYGTGEKQPQTIGCKQADGLYCDLSGSKTCKKLVANGSACGGSGECVEGSFCNNWICSPNLKQGEACETYKTVCETGLYCDEGTKVCAPAKHMGEPCTTMGECVTMDCTDGKCGPGLGALFSAMMICKM